MDIERIVVRMGADATQYLRVFDVVEARLVAFSSFLIEEMLRSSMRLAMDFERMGIAFEVMTGSAEKGRAVLNDIVDLAIRTPFTTQELIKSGKQAMAFGFEMQDIIPVLSRLGDVSVATGSDMDRLILALGQVRTTGRLMGQELRQFTNAGVPILQYLAKAIGTSEAAIPQLVRMGRVSFNDVAQAFNLMTSAGGKFFGMMERTNIETVYGKWQNFTENVQKFSRRIGEAIFEAFDVRGLLTDWNTALNGLDLDKIKDGMRTFKDIVVAVWNAAKGLVNQIQAFAEAHPGLMRVVKTTAALAAAVLAGATVLKVLTVGFGVFMALFGPLLAVVGALFVALKGIVVVGAAVVFTFLGSTAIIALLVKLAVVVGIILAVTGVWKNSLQDVWDVFKGLGGFVMDVLGGIGSTLLDVVVGALEQVGRSLGRLFDTFGGLSDIFSDAGKGIFAAFAMGDTELGFQLLLKTLQFGFKVLIEWVKAEWGLMWTEVGINMYTALRVKWVEFMAFAGRTMGQLLGPLLDKLGIRRNTDAQINAQRDRDILQAQTEGQQQLADAATEANGRIQDLIRSMRSLPEVQQIRDMQAEARAKSTLGTSMVDFLREFEHGYAAWEGRNRQGSMVPAIELSGAHAAAIGSPALIAAYEAMYMEAAQRGMELWRLEFNRGKGELVGFGRGLAAAVRAGNAFQALNQFRDEITGVAGALREATRTIGLTMEVSAQTRAYWLDLEKDIAKGTTALDKFSKAMGMIEEASVGPFRTEDRLHAAMAAVGGAFGALPGLGNVKLAGMTTPGSPEEQFALFREYDALRKAIPRPEDRRPGAALEGSREAAEILARNNSATLDVQQEIRATLIQANEIHRENARYQKEVADEVRQLRREGVIIPVPIKP